MLSEASVASVEAAMLAAPKLGEGRSAANLGSSQAVRLPLQGSRVNAFTLAELVVTVGVLVLLVFLVTQLLNSAATITTLGHKQMDADAQTRQVLDRMAIDFAQMVKRSDVDYYLKSSATPPPTGVRNLLQPGNDKTAFYSSVPGYYPSSGSQSPVSLVAYRVNPQHKLERMGKGLVWNAVSTTDTPVVFMPIPLASPLPIAELPDPTPTVTPTPAWRSAVDFTAPPTPEPSVELFGPQVFRFEYYYLLKGQTDIQRHNLQPHPERHPMGHTDLFVPSRTRNPNPNANAAGTMLPHGSGRHARRGGGCRDDCGDRSPKPRACY